MPFTVKRPGERELFAFRYRALLPDAVTITSAVWTVTVVEGTDASPSSMISGSAVILADKVSQLIIGGTADVKYCLSCEATFSDGQEVVLCDTLWVRESCEE